MKETTEEDLFIHIKYSFSSGIGSREVSDCITDCKGIVYADDYDNDIHDEYVGEIDFKIMNLGQAEIEGFDIYELFDTYEYTFRHAQDFYDLQKGSFNKSVLKEFPELEFEYDKICIIETIGIVQKFLGKGIGIRVFKDLVWRFDSCKLFILQPYPLQFELPNSKRELSKKLDLEIFEKDEKKATSSLSKYYQSWGFKKIRGMKDLMFYCPLYRNQAFDNIDMDNF